MPIIDSSGDPTLKNRYRKEQIIKAIKQHEAGVKVNDICRELGISNGTFYNWLSKYAGLEVSEAQRLRELKSENAKLKLNCALPVTDRGLVGVPRWI